MPSFALLTPMPGLPWYLLPIWPPIFWRIQRLKAWFRENGYPGAQMLWGVMNNGRVILIRVSDSMSGHRPCSFRPSVSDRLRLALGAAPSPTPDPTSPSGYLNPTPSALTGAAGAGPRLQPKKGMRNQRLIFHQRRRRLLFGASFAPRGTRTSFIFGW
jgi:hypothetical protein